LQLKDLLKDDLSVDVQSPLQMGTWNERAASAAIRRLRSAATAAASIACHSHSIGFCVPASAQEMHFCDAVAASFVPGGGLRKVLEGAAREGTEGAAQEGTEGGAREDEAGSQMHLPLVAALCGLGMYMPLATLDGGAVADLIISIGTEKLSEAGVAVALEAMRVHVLAPHARAARAATFATVTTLSRGSEEVRRGAG
jgi:hypothetical protein